MSTEGKSILAAIAVSVVLLALWMLYLPVLQAGWRYDAAPDDETKCIAAQEKAYALAGVGMKSAAEEWNSRAGAQCAMNRLRDYSG